MKTSTDPQGPRKLTTPLAAQFQCALANKEKRQAAQCNALPNLGAINVTVASDDDVAKLIEEARGRSEYAREAAKKIIQIRGRRLQLELVEARGGILTSAAIAELKQLVVEENAILSAGDGELQAALTFALFIEEIRSSVASAENAIAFLGRAVAAGRFREATTVELRAIRAAAGKHPSGTLFYAAKAYIPAHSGAAQRALEAELRKFIIAVKANDKKAEADEIGFILQSGSHQLDELRKGTPGTYALDLPYRKSAERTFLAGFALVVVERRRIGKGGELTIIKVIRGAGGLSWLNEHKGKWISLASFRRDASDANLAGDLLEFSNKFIRTIKTAVAVGRRKSAQSGK